MERQFCINWHAIIEEAKQRRKSQHLTQAQLAELAGVSTPTISRFEHGEKDIQLSTIINVLTVLGMTDQRTLTFSEQNEYYDADRMMVVFSGKDGNKTIRCAISEEALVDYFAHQEKDCLKVFRSNRSHIEQAARRKYLTENIQNDLILLTTNDFG